MATRACGGTVFYPGVVLGKFEGGFAFYPMSLMFLVQMTGGWKKAEPETQEQETPHDEDMAALTTKLKKRPNMNNTNGTPRSSKSAKIQPKLPWRHQHPGHAPGPPGAVGSGAKNPGADGQVPTEQAPGGLQDAQVPAGAAGGEGGTGQGDNSPGDQDQDAKQYQPGTQQDEPLHPEEPTGAEVPAQVLAGAAVGEGGAGQGDHSPGDQAQDTAQHQSGTQQDELLQPEEPRGAEVPASTDLEAPQQQEQITQQEGQQHLHPGEDQGAEVPDRPTPEAPQHSGVNETKPDETQMPEFKVSQENQDRSQEGTPGSITHPKTEDRSKNTRNIISRGKVLSISTLRGGKNRVKSSGRNRVKKFSETQNGTGPDIRKYFTDTKSINNIHTGNCEIGGRDVFGNIQDEDKSSNYSVINDRGPFSFSLIDADYYQDLSQDDLREIALDHWLVYKQDL